MRGSEQPSPLPRRVSTTSRLHLGCAPEQVEAAEREQAGEVVQEGF